MSHSQDVNIPSFGLVVETFPTFPATLAPRQTPIRQRAAEPGELGKWAIMTTTRASLYSRKVFPVEYGVKIHPATYLLYLQFWH